MARPTTPKLPVNKTLISEVLQRASNAKTKTEKVEILKEYETAALKRILLCNFARSISFVFPEGKTPYKPNDAPKGTQHQVLLNEHRMLEKFIVKNLNGVGWFGCSNNTRPSLSQLKKENLWMQIMEGLHPEESEVLDLVKDKKLHTRYKITRQNVIDAFPELKLQEEQ